MWIYATTWKAGLDFAEKRLKHRGHAATYDENVRVKEIDDGAEPGDQYFDCFEKNFPRQGIAGGISLSHHFAGDGCHASFCEVENRGTLPRFSIEFGACPSTDSRTGGQYFDASAFAAAANGVRDSRC